MICERAFITKRYITNETYTEHALIKTMYDIIQLRITIKD